MRRDEGKKDREKEINKDKRTWKCNAIIVNCYLLCLVLSFCWSK